MQQQYSIRQIRESDIEMVLVLLANLAAEEGLSERFTFCNNPSLLRKQFFSDDPDWFSIVAEADDVVAGVCTYSFSNINREFNPTACLYIDDIYVAEEYRKKGIATAFFEELKNIAKQQNVNRLEWWVADGNESGKRFYEKLNASRVAVDVFRLKI